VGTELISLRAASVWEVLNEIDNAPAAEEESRPLADDLSLQLWQDRTAA
jgi:hypothetical protein